VQQDGAPSHTARNTQICSVRTFCLLSQTFCPPNSPDLNTAKLPSGVLFSRWSTIINVSPQLTKWRERLSKAWQKLPHCAIIANSSLLSLFYLRLMLFARWRHYFPKLIQINYGVIFRMKRPRFMPNLAKILFNISKVIGRKTKWPGFIGLSGPGITVWRKRSTISYKKAVLSQRWPRDARYISRLWAVAEIYDRLRRYGHLKFFQDGGDRHWICSIRK